jgi:hypothetical protein
MFWEFLKKFFYNQTMAGIPNVGSNTSLNVGSLALFGLEPSRTIL